MNYKIIIINLLVYYSIGLLIRIFTTPDKSKEESIKSKVFFTIMELIIFFATAVIIIMLFNDIIIVT